MKKWMLLISPVLFMSSSVEAWGSRSINTSPAAAYDTHFPMNDDQGWFVEESYLLMKPSLGELEYGDMIFANAFGASASDFEIKVKKPEFKWNSGVRLGIGRYLPKHDKWDVSIYTTYLYGDAEDHAHGNLDEFKGLSANYAPLLFILSDRTEAQWHLNYFVWDLMAGRLFAMTHQITVHPYIGLRAALIYDKFISRSSGDITVNSSGSLITESGKTKVSMHQNFWGIGPRIGSNFDFKFTGNWSILGNFATSLLYGHYNVKSSTFSSVTPVNNAFPSKIVARDKDDVIRINLEGAIGLGWEHWFRNNTVRLAPNIQFEGSLWFDMNDFFKPVTVLSQDHGNLGLMGLTFNLQTDF